MHCVEHKEEYQEEEGDEEEKNIPKTHRHQRQLVYMETEIPLIYLLNRNYKRRQIKQMMLRYIRKSVDVNRDLPTISEHLKLFNKQVLKMGADLKRFHVDSFWLNQKNERKKEEEKEKKNINTVTNHNTNWFKHSKVACFYLLTIQIRSIYYELFIPHNLIKATSIAYHFSFSM